MEKFDVVIVGSGPAGLAAAKILGEGGKKTVILEKNPQIGLKICAGGLTPKARKLGIPLSLTDRMFYSLKIHAFGKTIEVKHDDFLVATVHREKLSRWMSDRTGKNVEIRLNSEVTEIKDNVVFLKNEEEIKFNYLIGADGSLSRVRQYLKLPTKRIWVTVQYAISEYHEELEIFLEPNLFGSCFAWIFPHKDYTFFGCGGELKSQKVDDLRKNFLLWLKERKIDISNSKIESFPINFDYQGFSFKNIFLIGDAAGLASGLTGEGMYSAILSGQEAARKILDPNYKLPYLQKILKTKIIQEKVGKPFMLSILKRKRLTQYLFKKIALNP